MSSTAQPHEILRELTVREKWRFLHGRVLGTAALEIDEDALHSHYDMGHSAESPLGLQTGYGRSYSRSWRQ